MLKSTFLFFLISSGFAHALILTDKAHFIDSESLPRIQHWSDRIEREFGVPITIETYPQFTGLTKNKAAVTGRAINADVLNWANERATASSPQGILLLVIREGGFVVVAIGRALVHNQEFLLSERTPVIQTLETHLAEKKESAAFVSALRLIFATLQDRATKTSTLATKANSPLFEGEWGLLLPWAIVAAMMALVLLGYGAYALGLKKARLISGPLSAESTPL